MSRPEVAINGARAALARGTAFFGFWLLLAAPGLGETPATDLAAKLTTDLAVGLLAAAVATWVSLRLLPSAPGRLRAGVLVQLMLRFFGQSTLAGLHVAGLAFDPRLPLKPGYLLFPARLPPGPGRAAFTALTSLVPGTLPVGTDDRQNLVYHCLDVDQPVAAGLARDEALLMRLRGGAGRR